MSQTLWKTRLAESVCCPPIVVGETVLLGTRPSDKQAKQCSLLGISLVNGEPRWQHTFDYALISGMQTYHLLAENQDIGVVATGSTHFLKGSGGVFAFTESGEIVWSWQGEAKHYSAPKVMARQLLVVAGAKNLAIISPDPEGGAERHIPLTVNGSSAAPAVHNGVIYIPCRSPELIALDLNGDVRWHFQYETNKRDWLEKTPIITNEHLFTVSNMGKLFALDTESGNLVWQENLGVDHQLSRPALADNRLFVGTESGLIAFDARNGRRLWTFETTRPVTATPLVYGESIYMACEDHVVYKLAVDTGTEQMSLEMERRIETPPVLTPTSILVVDRGGTILALPLPSLPDLKESNIVPKIALQQQQKELAAALSEQGDHLKSAEIWFELGELEQAAQEYELADRWLQAAKIWLQLDHFGKRAQAFKGQAKYLSQQDVDPEEVAQAWEQAARAYIETGQTEERLNCEREVARYRRQPFLIIEIKPEGLRVNEWSMLEFTIHNNGFGIARFVTVSINGKERFEGKKTRTKTMPTITPGKEFSHALDIYPRQHGSSVPLRLSIEYSDKSDQGHKLERTFLVEVTNPASETTTERSIEPITDPKLGTSELLARLPVPDNINLIEIRNKIAEYFSRNDLESLILEFGLDPEEFVGTKSKLAKELILYLTRRNQLEELISILERERPKVQWVNEE